MARARKRKNRTTRRRLHQEPIVREIARLLDTGTPTKFRWSSAAHRGLRAAMCLQGETWERAESMAGQIVTLALHRIGAGHRPTWRAGQPEPKERDRERFWCAACGGRIDEATSRPWCSDECRDILKKRRWQSAVRREERARQGAIIAALGTCGDVQPERSSARFCRQCKEPFTPRNLAQRYCSRLCGSRAGKHPPLACPMCEKPFSPLHEGHTYCSAKCAAHARQERNRAHLTDRPCSICGTSFSPLHGGQVYCGDECAAEALRRQKGHRRRDRIRDCLVCAEPFTARGPALYCGPKCIAEANRRRYADRKAPLAKAA